MTADQKRAKISPEAWADIAEDQERKDATVQA